MSSPALLVDTNVWLDFALGPRSGNDARTLVVWALENDVRLGIAAHSLKDLFVLVERDLKRQNSADPKIDAQHVGPAARAAAWAVVEQLLERVEVVGSDYMDALLATKYRALHDYYEDNLVLAAAERMGADALVTNDRNLLKHATANALTPPRALIWLQANA